MATDTARETFRKAIIFTAHWEGGYVNDKYDAGGETKYGISKRAYPHIDIPSLTREQADDIYFEDYFLKPRFDLLDERIACCCFDFGVNSGTRRSARFLQRAVGATADGYIGPATMDAVHRFTTQVGNIHLVVILLEMRRRFVRRIAAVKPSQKRFLKGWENRIDSLGDWLVTPDYDLYYPHREAAAATAYSLPI